MAKNEFWIARDKMTTDEDGTDPTYMFDAEPDTTRMFFGGSSVVFETKPARGGIYKIPEEVIEVMGITIEPGTRRKMRCQEIKRRRK